MAYGNGANGATHESPQAAAIASIACSDNGHSLHMSPERLQNIRELLSEPFDPGEIKWRVTATSTHQGKHGPQKSIDVLNGGCRKYWGAVQRVPGRRITGLKFA